MSSIGVYTTEAVLEHKKRDGKRSEERYCYWSFGINGMPPSFKEGDSFFIAVKGKWQGYFGPCFIAPEGIGFCSEDWHELPEELKQPRKPFQGYTKNTPYLGVRP